MKCIRCERDCKYDERRDGKCPSCGGRFALEPRTGDKLSDGLFHGAVKAVSSDGKVRWHLENLYYEVCRRKPQPASGCVSCTLSVLVMLALVAVNPPDGQIETVFYVVGWGGIVAAFSKMTERLSPTPLFSRVTFNKEWSRWAEAHGVPPSMIVPTARARNDSRKALESDLADYSFDRAVICDLPETVDLLVANNFHFENNCAVLTADGYPPQAFDSVRKMLQRNPRLKVWVLHDATPVGCRLAHRLKDEPGWFAEGVTIIDVGLRPGNAKPLHKLWTSAVKTSLDLQGPAFSAEEGKWLAKHSLALAAIRPEQVIKRLFRSISTDHSDMGMVGGVYVDSTSFSADASTSDGGGDSFG